MSDLLSPAEWYVQNVETWRKLVFSKNLAELLQVAAREMDFTADLELARPAAAAALRWLGNDTELRYWLHEQAAVPEALAVYKSVDLILGSVRSHALDERAFGSLVDSLRHAPGLLGVARLGLAAEHGDRLPSSNA